MAGLPTEVAVDMLEGAHPFGAFLPAPQLTSGGYRMRGRDTPEPCLT